jgi:hypothetical protein
MISYGLMGAVCGALGQQPLKRFFDSPAVLLPWVLVLVLLLMATGLDKKIPQPAFLKRFVVRSRFRAGGLSSYGAASAMGFLTPLLPCGPLYAVFFTALLTGSAAKGAEFTVAFGLGTVPLLWLAQSQFHKIRAMLTPLAMSRLRRGLALATALMLMWRLHGTIPPHFYGGEEKDNGELPSCCH